MTLNPNRDLSLYTELAWVWPVLSPPEDYFAEACALAHLMLAAMNRSMPDPWIGSRNRADTNAADGVVNNRVAADQADGAPWADHEKPRLLELGAGGGHTLSHLVPWFDVQAMDRSEAMLQQLQTLLPDVPTHVGDMTSFRTDQTFDAVLIHDASDYLIEPDMVRQTLATAYAHLKPAGVLAIMPSYTAATLVPGDSASDQATDPVRGVQVHHEETIERPDDLPDHQYLLHMDIAVTQADGNTGRSQQTHVCAAYDIGDWLAMLDETGFDSSAFSLSQAVRAAGEQVETLAQMIIEQGDALLDGLSGCTVLLATRRR